jgi:hypothetical protein
MVRIFIVLMAIGTVMLSACNSSGDKSKENHDMDKMGKDPAQPTTVDDKDIKAVPVTFTNVGANISGGIKNIVGHYLHIKNALVNDDSKEAASQGKALAEGMGKLDKSFFTPEQKKIYDGVEEDLKEHAGHIGENAGNIKHQREHFSTMSQDVYDLAKAFGGGRTLYHDHCPMYNDNKGAMWLSETKEIKNPYYGSEMLTCGTVEEKIQ